MWRRNHGGSTTYLQDMLPGPDVLAGGTPRTKGCRSLSRQNSRATGPGTPHSAWSNPADYSAHYPGLQVSQSDMPIPAVPEYIYLADLATAAFNFGQAAAREQGDYYTDDVAGHVPAPFHRMQHAYPPHDCPGTVADCQAQGALGCQQQISQNVLAPAKGTPAATAAETRLSYTSSKSPKRTSSSQLRSPKRNHISAAKAAQRSSLFKCTSLLHCLPPTDAADNISDYLHLSESSEREAGKLQNCTQSFQWPAGDCSTLQAKSSYSDKRTCRTPVKLRNNSNGSACGDIIPTVSYSTGSPYRMGSEPPGATPDADSSGDHADLDANAAQAAKVLMALLQQKHMFQGPGIIGSDAAVATGTVHPLIGVSPLRSHRLHTADSRGPADARDLAKHVQVEDKAMTEPGTPTYTAAETVTGGNSVLPSDIHAVDSMLPPDEQPCEAHSAVPVEGSIGASVRTARHLSSTPDGIETLHLDSSQPSRCHPAALNSFPIGAGGCQLVSRFACDILCRALAGGVHGAATAMDAARVQMPVNPEVVQAYVGAVLAGVPVSMMSLGDIQAKFAALQEQVTATAELQQMVERMTRCKDP